MPRPPYIQNVFEGPDGELGRLEDLFRRRDEAGRIVFELR